MERLEYLEKKNWSLEEITEQIVKKYQKEKKDDGELFFKTRILDKYFWIPIWRNLGKFNGNPKVLRVEKNNIKKSEEYKKILMKCNLKEITTMMLDFTIDNHQKIQFITELSNLFDEPNQKLIQELIKEKLIESDNELLTIQFINILITLRNIMKERLEYLEKKKWSLEEITEQIVKKYQKENFKDVTEEDFSDYIRNSYKDIIKNNDFDEQDNTDKKVWIIKENEIPEIRENNQKEEMLYNFSKIKQDNELKEFEINKEILNPPKYENLANINEYIN